MLERAGLTGRADDRVGGYSLGMRQRLGIARCLLSDPQLLILDEPMNGLDPAGILEMRHMIRSLVDEGRTVVVSSHLLDEVEKTCDMVAIIDRGRLVASGRYRRSPMAAGRSWWMRRPVPRDDGAAAAAAVTAAEGRLDRRAADDPGPGVTVAEMNRWLVEEGLGETVRTRPRHPRRAFPGDHVTVWRRPDERHRRRLRWQGKGPPWERSPG